MKLSIKTKTILGTIGVILVSYLVTALVGTYFISTTVREQVQDKVRLDLNTAREVYNNQLQLVYNVVKPASIYLGSHKKENRQVTPSAEPEESIPFLRFFSSKPQDKVVITGGKWDFPYLRRVMEEFGLDFLTLTDNRGVVIFRARNPERRGDSQKGDQLVSLALQRKEVSATQLISRAELSKESEELAQRCYFKAVSSPHEHPSSQTENTDGLVLKSAVPIKDDQGRVLGVIYGGKVLNRDSQIVDRVKDIVYRGERFMGQDLGTCTIFLRDLRIATNVKDREGNRAVGTRISAEVYERVFVKGKPWVGRAFVVTGWYITAYESIKDAEGNIIGALYVGYSEKPFVALRNKTLAIFALLSFLGIFWVAVFTGIIAQNIASPLMRVVEATRKISGGDLSYRLPIHRRDEIGELASSFNQMAEDLKSERERLEVAYKKLIAADKHKSDFLSMVSHELRTPLTSMSAALALLLDGSTGPLSPVQQEFLEISLSQAEKLTRMISDLLDLARIEAGGFLAHKKWFNLSDIIQREMSGLKTRFQEKELELVTAIPQELPRLWIDGGRVGQVITNLLTNAIKFTSAGGRVTLKVEPRGKEILITVEDNGRGLEEKQLNKIFDRFYQADGSTSRSAEGAGLGLAIAKYIVHELHGGKIWAESPGLGQGSAFFFTLPFARPEPEESAAQEVMIDEAKSSDYRG